MDRDIFNIEEEIQPFINEKNQDDLHMLIEEMQQNHFPNVIYKAEQAREIYQDDDALVHKLWQISAMSHAQIEEYHQASTIITDLYYNDTPHSTRELLKLGQMAFMSDYKLARRIMTAVIQRFDTEEEETAVDTITAAYLVLAESEENLQKLKRAVKYYQKALGFLSDETEATNYMKLFLSFKTGMVYTNLNELEAALKYLKQSLEYADETAPEIQIYSLVSIGRIYGELEKGDKGYPYLQEALRMLPESSLGGGPVHAEALMEVAYYYYNQGEYAKAAPVYEEAINTGAMSKNAPPRKLGMMYMQYAYCLANQNKPQNKPAGTYYEKAIELLEQEDDIELLHSALQDVIDFFEEQGNGHKKRDYEKRMLKLAQKV